MKKSRESRVLLILLALVLTLSMQTAGVFGVDETPADEGAPAVETAPLPEESPAAAPADDFQMTLPTVYLHITVGDDGKEGQDAVDAMNASEYHTYHCKGTMDIIVPEGFSYVDSDAGLESVEGLSMDIRGRGNTSWGADKKPYKIKLDEKTKILGMGKNKHWALLANAYDPTLMRNRITYWLGRELGMAFTPSGYPVDVFMEGEYYGTYLLCETIRVDKNRVEIDELTEDDQEAPAITGGYFIQFMQDPGSEAVFDTKKGTALQNVEPNFDPEEGDDQTGTEEQKAYIRGYLQEAEDALHEGETPDENDPSGYRALDYRDYYDLDSAALYWLFQEFTMNCDAYTTGSSYMYKTRDRDGEPGSGRIFWGPLWDFDYAYDYMGDPIPGDGNFLTQTEWMTALMTDGSEGSMRERIKAKWPEFRAALIEVVEPGGIIDQYYEEVKASQAYDQEKHGWEDDEGNPLVYKAAVEALRSWILGRIEWFDENLDKVDDYSHKVAFKKDVDDEHPLVNCYRTGDTVNGEIEDPVKEGYFFLGWYTDDGVKREEARVDKDLVFTAKYVKEEEATKVNDILFMFEDLYIPLSEGGAGIRYTALPEDAQNKQIWWSSADEQIATIEGGAMILVHSLGTTTITAHLPDGSEKSFRVIVTEEREPYKSAEPAHSPIYLKPGEKAQVRMKIDAPSAFTLFEFMSEDPEIAEVGMFDGVVTAAAPGRAKIKIDVSFPQGDEWVTEPVYCDVIVTDSEGELTTETKADGIAGEAENLKEVAESLLTRDDEADLAGGADILVQLEMTLLEEGSVPAEDAAPLQTYLEKEGLTAGAYIDMRLLKTIGEGEPEEVHETPVPVQFSVEVPASLANTDEAVTRTFHLLRVHDGQVAEVGSGTGGTITGESGLFSTYLVAYSDEEKQDEDAGGGSNSGDKQNGGKDSNSAGSKDGTSGSSGNSSKTVKTGDDSRIGGILLLSGVSLATLIGLLASRKRKACR